MARWTGTMVMALLLCACAADAADNGAEDGTAAVVSTATSGPPAATAAESTAPPVTTAGETAPPAATPSGSTQACGAGQRLDDPDADTWGECVADERPIDLFAAQVAAEAAGLPAGIPCGYPATIVAGDSALISCPVVNPDASEGEWTFRLASDSSVSEAASYTQTKAAPPTMPPATEPIRPLVGSMTDPRFGTCKEAKSHGYGPYYAGDDPEYGWYRDADDDGIVCE